VKPILQIRQQAAAEVWAILPSVLREMLADNELDSSPIEREAVVKRGPKAGSVAQVNISGPISRHDSMWMEFFGGTSVDGLLGQMKTLANDATVSTVLLNIDSPGGTVNGLPELAATIRALRETKHVVALSNSLAASAAYWIASQADEIIATPEALTGSIGVFAMHEDWSKAFETAGVKVNYVSAGKYKTEGNPTEPLSEEARAHLQSLVDDAYDLFVNDVATGRGASVADVRNGFGEGRVLTSRAAKAAGLIDRVATFSETVTRLVGSRTSEGNSQARNALKRRRLMIAEKSN
jgi:capsid assembly protease